MIDIKEIALTMHNPTLNKSTSILSFTWQDARKILSEVALELGPEDLGVCRYTITYEDGEFIENMFSFTRTEAKLVDDLLAANIMWEFAPLTSKHWPHNLSPTFCKEYEAKYDVSPEARARWVNIFKNYRITEKNQ